MRGVDDVLPLIFIVVIFMQTSTICAVATAPGGALGVVRVAGPDALAVTDRVFRARSGRPLAERRSHTLAFGHLVDPADETIVDEVLVSVFRAPHSYTGEEATEISCHGSTYILQRVVQLLLAAGAEPAEPGEFTRRAFLNGKMDLSQAEAVADLIASSTAASHRVAMSQMRGHFSQRLAGLREQLQQLTSLLELELDFSDHEDLEFADRSELDAVAAAVERETARLADSFATGNALREGWPVAIVGATNAGKSTLLNALLQDDRAIVSDVHGTTRDVVEDTFVLGGVLFRFIDTAGLRDTTDRVEQMGIERSRRQLQLARTVIFVVDVNCAESQLAALSDEVFGARTEGRVIVAVNKADCLQRDGEDDDLSSARRAAVEAAVREAARARNVDPQVLFLSAKEGGGVAELCRILVATAAATQETEGDVVVTNARHYAALSAALDDVRRVRQGLQSGLSGDFVAQDLRECLHHLAEITGGEVTTDEVLGTIFKNFCVGK